MHHPVLDDPELVTWQAYTARAWPTLVVVDPEGYIVASHVRRGARARAGRPGRGAGRRARGQGHAAPRRRPVCRAAASRDRAAVPREGRRPARTARSSCRDTAHHQLVLAATAEAVGDGAGPVSAAAGGRSTSRRACSRCRRRRPRGSATTSWSRTRSTTSCAACGWPTARWHRAGRNRQPAARAVRQRPGARAGPLDAVGPRLVRRPGRHRDGRHPPAVGVAPGRRPGGNRGGAGRHDRGGDPRRRRRRGVVRPAVRARGVAPTAGGCGSRTPRRPRCARSTCTDDGFEVLTARRAGAVRLRPRRRPGGPGAAAAPARRHGAAGRLGGRERHLQRRRPPVRPGHAARSSTLATGLAEPSDAVVETRGAERHRCSSSSSPRRTGWCGCRCRTRPSASTAWPTRPSGRATELAAGTVALDGDVHAADRAEARLPLGRPDPAGRSRATPGGLLRRGRRRRPGPDPRRWSSTRRSATASCTSRVQAAVLRRRPGDRRGARARRLPPLPAGLGHPGAARRRGAAPSSTSTCAASEP